MTKTATLLITFLFLNIKPTFASDKIYIFDHTISKNQKLRNAILQYTKETVVIDKNSITAVETIKANKGIDLKDLKEGQTIKLHISQSDIDPSKIPLSRLNTSKTFYGKFDYMISIGTGYRVENKYHPEQDRDTSFTLYTPLLLNARAFENFKKITDIFFSIQTNLIRTKIKTSDGQNYKSKPEFSFSLGKNFISSENYLPVFLSLKKTTEYSLISQADSTTVKVSDNYTISPNVGFLYRFSVYHHSADIFTSIGSDVFGRSKKRIIFDFYYDQEIYRRLGATINTNFNKAPNNDTIFGGFVTLSYFY